MLLPERVRSAFKDDVTIARRFYEIFFERCPAARKLFEGVDLREQEVMLQMALVAIIEYPDMSNAVASYLRVLGTRHFRAKVPQDLYPAFFDAITTTLAEFAGDAWNSGLERQWKQALEAASSLMLEGYEQRSTT